MSVVKTVWVAGKGLGDEARLCELDIKVSDAQVRVIKIDAGAEDLLSFRRVFSPASELFSASPKEAWQKFRADAVRRLQQARADADEAARDIGVADAQIAECQS